MSDLRLAMAQLDTVVGDLSGNVARVVSALARAAEQGAQLCVFPELAITGYPPEDLLLKPGFVADNLAALDEVAAATGTCTAVVGFVDRLGGAHGTARLANAAAVCRHGQVEGVYHKQLLPNYGVFDEARWFVPGPTSPRLYDVGATPLGVSICEDVWSSPGPVIDLGRAGAGVVVNLNASPYSIGRRGERARMLQARARQAGCAIAYVNQVGGQDELVFDGASLLVDAQGTLVAAGRQFAEDLVVADLFVEGRPGSAPARPRRASRGAAARPDAGPDPSAPVTGATGATRPPPTSGPLVHPHADGQEPATTGAPRALPLPQPLGEEAEVYAALVLGTHDYLAKNGFSDAVIGLSGGIDSSLVATIAVDALGAEHVHAVSMPSRYSSEGSRTDAAALAANLGIRLHTVGIEDAHQVVSAMVGPVLGGPPSGLTDENLQSRLRGLLLMTLSNATGWIVLTTGNKSELATGYSTLYGDSAGGFAVIKDVPKTLVYRLCRWRNERALAEGGVGPVPGAVLEKAPSAELRPDQRDDQSLPPYEELDPVLAAYVEQDRTAAELRAEGYDPALVALVVRLVDQAEYKRRQMPPGVRITAKAFGRDRRMPITNRYGAGAVGAGAVGARGAGTAAPGDAVGPADAVGARGAGTAAPGDAVGPADAVGARGAGTAAPGDAVGPATTAGVGL